MKRSFAGITAVVVVAGLVACGPGQSSPKQTPRPSSTPTVVQATLAPTPTPGLSEFTQVDTDHYLRLQKEQPKLFKGCINQDVEPGWDHIPPNLHVLGVVWFSEGGYPNGFKTKEFGTHFTVIDSGTNVTVKWTQPSGFKLDSVIVYREHLSDLDKWLRWTQHERGDVNAMNFNKGSWESRVGDAWYIMGHNRDVPCGGRESDPYHQIAWRAMFRSGQLDKK